MHINCTQKCVWMFHLYAFVSKSYFQSQPIIFVNICESLEPRLELKALSFGAYTIEIVQTFQRTQSTLIASAVILYDSCDCCDVPM